MDSQIIVETDSASLCQRAATTLIEMAKTNAAEGRPFHVALAGGSTPKALYELLAQTPYAEDMPWEHLRFFFGDERTVPPEHDESNFRMANEALLSQVPLNSEQIHRIQGELEDANEAASLYDAELSQYLPRDEEGVSQFDLVLLGLGPDGHIASLFPDTDVLNNNKSRAAAVWVEKFNTWRISITFPLINHARNVWMFVCGEGKKQIIDEVLNHSFDVPKYPVQMIKARGQQVWYLDKAAAAKL